MAEYIAKEQVLAFPLLHNEHVDLKNAELHFLNGVHTLAEYVEDLPAADVVPVVRCKDCKWFGHIGGTFIDGECVEGSVLPVCRVLKSQVGGEAFFCGYGIRKDGEGSHG